MWSLQASRNLSLGDLAAVQQAYDDLLARTDIGFKDGDHIIEAIRNCQAHKEFFKNKTKIVVIGLGGSSLGTKALGHALFNGDLNKKICFLDNIDSHSVDHFLTKVTNPKEWGWILCSKSGSTIEVLSLFDYCLQMIEEKSHYSIIQDAAVITEARSNPLYDFAKEHNRPILPVPLNVGGRFSVFTSVGLFPLSFLGFKSEKALMGFQKVLANKDLVLQLSGHLYQSIKKGEVNFYSFPYCDRLNEWSLWLQQLWSESLSKAKTKAGAEGPVVSTLVPCRGASDQHSVLQQIMEGREKKFVCFYRVASSEKGQKIHKSFMGNSIMNGKSLGDLLHVEMWATEEAMKEAGIPTLNLATEDINEESLAYLMGLWMLTVGVLGELLGLNAFDQPGVESGKKITRRVLSQPH